MKTSPAAPRSPRAPVALFAVLAITGSLLLAPSSASAQDASGGFGGGAPGGAAGEGGGRGGGGGGAGGGGGGSRIGTANGSSSVVFSGLAPALISNLGPTAQGRLETAQRALDQALVALNRASASKAQPQFEFVVSNVTQARTHIGEALAFLQTHPELNALPPGPASSAEIPAYRLVNVPSGSRVPSLNLLSAVEELNAALSQFLNNPAANSRTPVIGDIGGFREKIMSDIGQAAAGVVALINAPAPRA